jgi:hypothetical protein
MDTRLCCDATSSTLAGGGRPPTTRRRFLTIIQLIVPGVFLALIPKCPLCFAGYTAVGCGMGLSISTETHLRLFLAILCVGLMCYLALRHFIAMIKNRSAAAHQKSTLIAQPSNH